MYSVYSGPTFYETGHEGDTDVDDSFDQFEYGQIRKTMQTVNDSDRAVAAKEGDRLGEVLLSRIH